MRALFEKSAQAAAVACYADEARDLEGVIREVLKAARARPSRPTRARCCVARMGADRAHVARRDREAGALCPGKSEIDVDDVEAIVGDASELAIDRIVNAAASGDAAARSPSSPAPSPPARAPQSHHHRPAALLAAPASHPHRSRRRRLVRGRHAPACARRCTSSRRTPSACSAACGRRRALARRPWRATAEAAKAARLTVVAGGGDRRGAAHRARRRGAPAAGRALINRAEAAHFRRRRLPRLSRARRRHYSARASCHGEASCKRRATTSSASAMPSSTSSAAATTASSSKHDLAKGFMRLIDARQADRLYAAMGPAIERSGGSAANTIAGLASFGGKCAFIGQVADDQFGSVFRHDIRALGVAFDTPPADRRRAHRALPDPRHAGRRAHHEHLPRRQHRARRRRRRRRADRGRQGHLSRGLSVRPAGGQGGVPRRPPRSLPRRGRQGRR